MNTWLAKETPMATGIVAPLVSGPSRWASAESIGESEWTAFLAALTVGPTVGEMTAAHLAPWLGSVNLFIDDKAYDVVVTAQESTAWSLTSAATVQALGLEGPRQASTAAVRLGVSVVGWPGSVYTFRTAGQSPLTFHVLPTPTTAPVSSIPDILSGSGRSQPQPLALKAFRDLARWLELPDDVMAGLVGIGRTTPYAWARRGSEGRPATTRRLYQLHALLTAVKSRLGDYGFGVWLRASVRELLLSGRQEEAIEQARHVLFPDSYERRVGLGAWTPEQESVRTSLRQQTVPGETSPRKARRVRRNR